ncbi:phage terminase large subunit [Curvivirga sp.]|uniref:phage terminase large subunit n=1 Tax=Curvivirga sp. TaxID=2856848 RepID=UPI003B5BADBC
MRLSSNSQKRITITFTEFVWIWNEIQGQGTPDIHCRMAHWLNVRWRQKDQRLLLMAFRAAGKSTIIGLFCAWILYLNPNLRIMILAAEQSLAIKMVRNVKRIIERHPLTQELKPSRPDQWASDRFTLKRSIELRDPSMMAKGIQANMTGSRADIVICDDVEVPNTCDTVPKREDLRQRLSEIDYILTPDGTQLYVGTPHSYFTIYADVARKEAGEDFPFLNGFKRLKIPIYNVKGEASWPERFGLSEIANLKRRQGPNKFKSQMMLDPVSINGGRLDLDKLGSYADELNYEERNGQDILLLKQRRMISASCWWDPAYGTPVRGDHSVIACVFTDEEGRYWLHRLKYLRTDTNAELDEARQQCNQVLHFVRELHLPSVTIETNGIGKFLPGLLRAVFRENGCRTAVLEHHSTVNKDKRLMEAFDSVLAAGQLKAHKSVWKTSFITEMREWKPGQNRTGVDDGLDAVAGCLLSEPVRLNRYMFEADSKLQKHKQPRWQGGGQQHQAHTQFEI